MYMKSVNDLKAEVLFELGKSTDNKVKLPEINSIHVAVTNWPNIVSVGVQFKDDKGFATALLSVSEMGTYKLLAPFDVHFNEKEEKKK